MKILITGGCGFIGSAVIREAISRDNNVINIDKLTYAGTLESLRSVEKNLNYTFIKEDICNSDAIKEIFYQYKPDCVMHLAAESHVDRSIDHPDQFINTNIFGTYNLLKVSLDYWADRGNPDFFRFHHISTDEVFGTLPQNKSIRFNEESSYDPRSPYSASKASSDHLVRSWHHTFKLPILITNCSNNYGPFHFPEKLIPTVIIKAILGEPIPVYGNGLHIRDWLFVEDHANALLLVLQKGVVGKSYNIGSENECTNIELVGKICEILDKKLPKVSGSYSDQILFVEDRPGHDKRYSIDPTRIKKELGWIPSVTLEKGLNLTIDWYLENQNWWKSLLKLTGGQRLGLKK